MTLTLALSYGSREEIVNAVKNICNKVKNNTISIDSIDDSIINEHLYTQNLPEVDLLIRTSGEHRISNYGRLPMRNYILLMYCGLTLKNKIYMRLSLVIKKRERRFEKQVNKLNNF
jgi:undecaprenyl diphosphate synthase